MSAHTLAEIGNMMNVSRERVRQIEHMAIKKLRACLELRDIRNEFVHQQGMAKRNCENSATDSEYFRENESNIFCYLDDGKVGVSEW